MQTTVSHIALSLWFGSWQVGECEINFFTHSNKTFTEHLIKHLFFYAACTISHNCHQHAKVQISQVLDGMMCVREHVCVSSSETNRWRENRSSCRWALMDLNINLQTDRQVSFPGRLPHVQHNQPKIPCCSSETKILQSTHTHTTHTHIE